MRKFVPILFAASLLVLMVACQRETIPAQPEEEMVETIFTVGGPQVTKALGDGSLATQLKVFVYDSENALVTTVQPAVTGTGPWTVKMTLLKGAVYHVAFWAQSEAAATDTYFTFSGQFVTVNDSFYSAEAQKQDAFWNCVQITGGEKAPAVTLSRPFALVRVMIPSADIATFTEQKISVYMSNKSNEPTGMPSEMSLISGAITGKVNTIAFPKEDKKDIVGTAYEGDATYTVLFNGFVLCNEKILVYIFPMHDYRESPTTTGSAFYKEWDFPLQRNHKSLLFVPKKNN